MGTETFPKGKKPANVGTSKLHTRQERFDDTYDNRPTMGLSEDVRYRQLTNDYGKTPQPDDNSHGGITVSPYRTIRSPIP